MTKKNDFSTLIEQLNASLIVFVENDFEPLIDFEAILSKLIFLPPVDIEDLLAELFSDGNEIQSFIESYSTFIKSVMTENHNLKKLIMKDRAVTALEISLEEHPEYTEMYNLGKRIISLLRYNANQNDSFFYTVLKYGIARHHESYNIIFSELDKMMPRKSIRFFTSATPTEWEQINAEVSKNLKDDEFCLFIVDKKLGEDNDEGEKFIDGNIISGKLRDRHKNIISIIYTSYQVEKQLHKINDYYTIEVNKRDPDALEQITIGLGTCAFVHIFDRLKNIHTEANNKAFEIAINRANNMKYLAKMAHEEGITPFEALNRWFDIAREDFISKELLKKSANLTQYHYILGLTQVLSETFFDSRASQWDFNSELEIQRLNTSEIFDYSINQLHLPPSPGDIFEKNGDFYILMGQDCDISIRRDKVTRKTQTAELLKCSFDNETISEKVLNDKDSLTINYFRNTNDEVGLLKVRFGNTTTADFSIIDLCAFNDEGKSMINIVEPLDSSILKVLPEAWKLNYLKLQDYLSNLVQIKELLNSHSKSIDVLSSYDLSVLTYNKDGDFIDYSINRVCRLKNEFRDLILRNYWNYKARVGLNTISVIDTETLTFSHLEYGHMGQEKKKLETEYSLLLQRTLNRDKNKSNSNFSVVINLHELKSKLPELSCIDSDEIIIEKKHIVESKSKIAFHKIINDDGSLKGISIIFPYRVSPSGRLIHNKDKFALFDFINPNGAEIKNLPKDTRLIFLNNNEEQDLFDSQGQLMRFEIPSLSRGIYIPIIDISVLLKGDTFYVESGLVALQIASTQE